MALEAADAARPLAGQVALVAGATRGAGRGIARMLGAAGALVFCTGRSVRGAPPATPGRPETVDETAEAIVAEGGRAVAVRVREEAGRLDVLVNDVWGGDRTRAREVSPEAGRDSHDAPGRETPGRRERREGPPEGTS